MKRISFLTTFSVIALFSLVLYMASCKPDPCKTRAVECNNGGTCKDGDCICAAGYEGESCQFKVNKKFDSYYACSARVELINNTPPSNDNDDTLRIKALNDKFGVKIYSIRDSLIEVLTASVVGNAITIKEQNIQFPLTAAIYKYYGTGSLNNGVLTITLYKELISMPANKASKITYVAYKYE
jgi:hypothetical protein